MRRSTFTRLLLPFVFNICFCPFVHAQDTVLNVFFKATLDSIHSGILNQNRLFQVFVPPQYKAGSKEKYDVVYVTDGGNWNAGLFTRTQHFIEDNDQMPPVIVVSVMGIDRNVELTPTRVELWQAPTGGADKFLAYIKTELIPYIDKHYPSSGINTLWGHSLGGMFAIYAMLKEPASFRSYIAVDPSMWWDNGLVARMAAEKLPALAGMHLSLYASGRRGPAFRGMKIDTLETVLKQWAPKDLKWQVVPYEDESHSSIRWKTIYDGLKFTYAGYSKGIFFYPANGTVLNDKPYSVILDNDTARTYYTTDGSEPTESSSPVKQLTTLTGPAKLTFRRIASRKEYDKSYSGDFVTGSILPPSAKPKTRIPGGLHYSYYESAGANWPDLKTSKPVKTGTTYKGFDSILSKKNNHTLVADGYIEIKDEGYYGFFLRGEPGSSLSIGDRELIRLTEKNKNEGSYLIPLTSGFYKIHIEELDKKDQFNLLLYYMTPASVKDADVIPIPAEVQFSSQRK